MGLLSKLFLLVIRAFISVLILFIISMPSYSSDNFFSPVASSHEKVEHLLSVFAVNQNVIPICYNYGCNTQHNIIVDKESIQSIKAIFNPAPLTAQNERVAISKAIAMLESISARQTPTYNDKAGNANDNGLSGRMDCIDATVNTTHYLQFINNLGLINYHQLQKPAYRSPFVFGQHWAAKIRDRTSTQSYVVDSWQTDNGQPPVIQKIAPWERRDKVNKN